jgi:hypothetical protein
VDRPTSRAPTAHGVHDLLRRSATSSLPILTTKLRFKGAANDNITCSTTLDPPQRDI